jgi:dolichyl-phosphate beta-glucosyltransferase
MKTKKPYDAFLRELTIVFPLYNEKRRVESTLKKIKNFYNRINSFPILIFVLDGCKDNTKDLLVENLRKNDLLSFSKIIDYKPNKGIGYAMHQGLKQVKTRYVLFSDFDLATPLSELRNLYSYLPKYDIVIGSRWLDRSKVKGNIFRKLLSSISIHLIKLMLSIKISDTQCGFKLFKTDIAKRVYAKRQINRFGVDFEIIFIASKKGYSIKEMPVEWRHEKGSKVGIFDYFKTLKELFRVRWNGLNGAYS